jgi:large subunit ribosomal protein L24
MHIRRDDLVRVISGEEAGKVGKVIKLFPGERRALVQGVNYVWKHLRKSADHPHGARIQKEAPLALAKLMLVCQSCNQPSKSKVGKLADGTKTRMCKKCKQPMAPGV